MTYQKQVWNIPDLGWGLDAAGLQHIEDGVVAVEAASQPIRTTDIRKFINSGETLAQDGTNGNNTAIFQRAVTALTAIYASTGAPQAIYVPNGRYGLALAGGVNQNGYAVIWAAGVGISGESQDGVIFLPGATVTAFYNDGGTTIGNALADCTFENFTIDGANQSWSSYTTSPKGIFIRPMIRPRWRNVTIKNTWGSGFGCDYLQDYSFQNVRAINCGRGIGVFSADPSTSLGGAGIGMGTGIWQDERGLINGAVLIGNRVGLFYEKQTAATYFSRGHVARGISAIGNWAGVQDCGCDALDVDAVVTDNNYGLLLDKTSLSFKAGINGHARIHGERNTQGDVGIGYCSNNTYRVTGTGRSAPDGLTPLVTHVPGYAAAGQVAINLAAPSTDLLTVSTTPDTYADNFGSNVALSGRTAPDGSSTAAWSLSDGGSGGVLTIASAAVKATAGTGNIFGYIDTTHADGSVHAKISAVNATATSMVAGIAVRGTDANNCIRVNTRNSGSVAGYLVDARVSGSGTTLITTSIVPQVNDVIRLSFSGKIIVLYLNDTVLGTAVCDTTAKGSGLVSNTKHGLFGNFAIDPTTSLAAWGYSTLTY